MSRQAVVHLLNKRLQLVIGRNAVTKQSHRFLTAGSCYPRITSCHCEERSDEAISESVCVIIPPMQSQFLIMIIRNDTSILRLHRDEPAQHFRLYPTQRLLRPLRCLAMTKISLVSRFKIHNSPPQSENHIPFYCYQLSATSWADSIRSSEVPSAKGRWPSYQLLAISP